MKLIDLFCGCGGMSLGFKNAGFELIGAYDNWKPATDVYALNFDSPVYCEDVRNNEVQEQIKGSHPEIIIGGPPCQDFSSAGHRDENLGRADLTKTFKNIIVKTMPKFFVMENVPEIAKSKIFHEIKDEFKKHGYGLTQVVLDASYCGVPQSRKRIFLIGRYNEPDDFMKDELMQNLSEKPMTMYDYFGDSLKTEYYFRVPRSYNRRGVFSIYEPCQTIRGVDRPIPPGYKKHPSDPVEIGPDVRTLTVVERSYVQTFPKNFVFKGTKTNLNQMIGNAVPVKLAEYVAKALIDYETKGGAKRDENR